MKASVTDAREHYDNLPEGVQASYDKSWKAVQLLVVDCNDIDVSCLTELKTLFLQSMTEGRGPEECGRTARHRFIEAFMNTAHRPASYAEYVERKEVLEESWRHANTVLTSLPGVGTGRNGLTPDDVKRTPQYVTARAARGFASDRLRAFNGHHAKRFAAHMAVAREELRATSMSLCR